MKKIMIVLISMSSISAFGADLQIKKLVVEWNDPSGRVVKDADGVYAIKEKGKHEYAATQSGEEHNPVVISKKDVIKVSYLNTVEKVYLFSSSFKGFSCSYRDCYLKMEISPKFTKNGAKYFEIQTGDLFPHAGVDFYLSRSPILNKRDSASFLYSI